jgi:hypothetical protein
MTLRQLERRVAALEKAVSAMAQEGRSDGGTQRWWAENAGRFANDPIFEEIVRLGKEYRESLRPRPQGEA